MPEHLPDTPLRDSSSVIGGTPGDPREDLEVPARGLHTQRSTRTVVQRNTPVRFGLALCPARAERNCLRHTRIRNAETITEQQSVLKSRESANASPWCSGGRNKTRQDKTRPHRKQDSTTNTTSNRQSAWYHRCWCFELTAKAPPHPLYAIEAPGFSTLYRRSQSYPKMGV